MRTRAIALALAAVFAAPATAEPRHGVAMYGEPALPADYSHFGYSNPDAPKGGEITYCVVGSFDNLNPFILKSLRTTARGVIDTIFGNLVFEPLMVRNADEPFSLYGLLAQSIEMPEDRSWAEFRLNPRARWSDGKPVRPEDVIFTYQVFAEKGRPPYRDRMSRIAKIEKTGEYGVRFTFNEKADREFPLIVALTPIIPEHAFDRATFDQTTLKPVTGSGPYLIDEVRPGERISFRRNPDYWAAKLPSKRGFDNYDRIRIEYFLNANAQFEAFKKGLCALQVETDPVKRARGYDFPAFRSGDVVAEEFRDGTPPVVTGFVFNTRLAKFADPKVREAISLLYDFEWANRTLYEGLYERTMSFWQGSELSALGHPASQREKELLSAWPQAVPPDVMDGTWRPPVTDGSGQDRKVLREALEMFKAAGLRLEGGRMLDRAGQPFAFEIVTASESEQRIASLLQRTAGKLGIAVTIRALDDTQIQQRKQRFDFEMIIGAQGFSNSLSPGTEQLGRWSSEAAKTEGSFNLAGVSDPAVDAVIDAMLRSRTKEDYVAAVRALDRLLISGHYMIPLQHNSNQWVARWKRYGHPERTSLSGYQLPTWWEDKP